MTNAIGQANPFSDAHEFNFISFIVGQALAKMQTVTICEVVGVNAGAQTVDVRVLVNIMTGNRQPVPHGTIYGRPYYRLQGSISGILCDPAVGDRGVLVFGSRDLTAVIAAKSAANPGSQRMFDWADGMYFGGVLNTTPTQYVQFTAGGITILSPTAVTIQSPDNTVVGPLAVTGTLAVTGIAQFTSVVEAHGGMLVTGTLQASVLQAGNGFSGTFATGDSRTVTVVDGIITAVA